MAFRFLFVTSYLIFILSLGSVFGFELANVVEKGALLVASLAFIATRRFDPIVALLLLATLLLVVVCGALTEYPYFSWNVLIGSSNQLIIVFALLAGMPVERDRETILTLMAWLPLACVVLGFAYAAVGLWLPFQTEYATGAARLGGTVLPAFLSGLAMCGVFSALHFVLERRGRVVTMVLFANVLILLLAGGRMALAVTVAISTLQIILQGSVPARHKMAILTTGVLAAVPLFFVAGELVLTRLLTSGANGRDILWNYLYSLSDQYPNFGVGWGHAIFNVPRSLSILTGSSAAHNDYIRILVELGQFGVVLFYLLLSLAVLRVATRHQARGGAILIVSYLGFLLLSLTDNALATPPYFPIVFLAYLAGQRPQQVAASSPPQPAVGLAHA